MYADVIIDISHEKVDRIFQYAIPERLEGLIGIGSCVDVPFGRGNTLRTAYVVGLSEKTDYPEERIKKIAAQREDAVPVTADAIRLAAFLKRTYGSTMIAALRTVLPAKKTVRPVEKKTVVRLLSVEKIRSLYAECGRKKQSAKERLLGELIREERIPCELVTGKLHVSAKTIQSLAEDGVIRLETRTQLRNPVRLSEESDDRPVLSDEQEEILREILRDFREHKDGGRGVSLIHGITGSGKTEVYLRLIEEVIAEGEQCIMLIPEIALTYQTLMRFYKRFGDRVSVLHSRLSEGERYDQCLRAERGEIDVIIGPRSALFVPFPKPGMVIMDEEHESSYISEQNPRYHTRETAEELCRIKGASLVLGSATPSLEAYHKAVTGEYRLFRLTRRLTGGTLPEVRIIDMRKELSSGNRSMFSEDLRKALEERIGRGEQSMLFLNRRGYVSFISCRACGEAVKCPHCEVSLVRHRGGKLMCHYCGYETADIDRCPHCGSKYISGFRAGTQQVEDEVKRIFPKAKVLRMDADTTRKKDSYEEILGAFSRGEADVLIGTQMIVKGHDFPKVTLVGIIAADLSLNESDFRTGERTFQLLTQACGRAGRGSIPGEALIQTYRPEHYSIVLSATQDYEAFYREEMACRGLCGYPPEGNMLEILITSAVEKRALGLAVALKKRCAFPVSAIGPAPAPIPKINDRYRYHLYLKCAEKDALLDTRQALEDYLFTAPVETETVSFTVL
ncbi:MAG: primosomal protein N' [Lachnospiraceae bacterium]|nr:primosomal protein N' [Lachnospiraceae bacterium]